MPSFSVAIVSADALAAANRRGRLVVVAVPGALGKEEQQKVRRPVVRSWTGVATIGLVISHSGTGGHLGGGGPSSVVVN
jgi:hypothetical protein